MTPQVMEKLNKAVRAPRAKGEGLAYPHPNMAFIVNIPNRTVVTAMDGESIRTCIHNIDSTVIAG